MNILVYTMGKVGSTTVMRAVESAGHVAGRGYPGNIHETDLGFFEAFVTMVRDPMARNISQYFELNQGETDFSLKDFTLNFDHTNRCLSWFEDWIQPTLGIDVYDEKFPKGKGWKVYDNLLVIKTEKFDDALGEGLDALGIPGPFIVEHRAYGNEKFGDRYARFVKTAKFDAELLDVLYESKMVKHFYLASEIKRFHSRWMARRKMY